MIYLNSSLTTGLVSIIVGAVLVITGGNDILTIIGGIIFIAGIYFIFEQKNDLIAQQDQTTEKRTVTTTETREVRSDGEVIVQRQRTETSAVSGGT